MGWLFDETGLDRCQANFVPLTPLSHLNRAREVFPERDALVYGDRRYNYRRYHERVTRLASALAARGVRPGDVVSTILPNIPAAVESHFGVPACGAVLNAINIRLDVDTIGYIFSHARPKFVLVDSCYLGIAEAAAETAEGMYPQIIEVADDTAGFPASGNYPEYEDMIASAALNFDWIMPEDEWESLTLNYTSGTTGRPKGVVYHHRGAYMMTMGTVISWRMTLYPKFLAIVPLFHCNGWNHSWMMPLLGGTVICCREVAAKPIFDAIADEGVTHFGGAPIVLNMLANAEPGERRKFTHRVEVFTAGAPPPAAMLEKVEKLNFNVTHVYGLTETYGHVTECIWKDDEWRGLGAAERADIKARQGVLMPMMEKITVVDPSTREEVARDGRELGEIVMRGNSVMKGYFRNPEATAGAFEGGGFRSGDIAVMHEDGYIRIADRSKDIIISGGENVSSVEVEGTIMHHPAVSLCAVVAKADEKWGEVPVAFVELIQGADCSEEEIISFCRKTLAGFKTPKQVIFRELPKTATGKIQKFTLREVAKAE
ncbi:MAG: AMP-binding protein [Rhodobacteraceae bacterium]|nr:AMP-binding protein [Paracoccaceae bacterium]